MNRMHHITASNFNFVMNLLLLLGVRRSKMSKLCQRICWVKAKVVVFSGSSLTLLPLIQTTFDQITQLI